MNNNEKTIDANVCGQIRSANEISEMIKIMEELEKDFDRLSHSEDHELLNQYGLGLVLSSRRLDRDPAFRYWTPADTIDGMPGDARAEFLYRPTYFAACILKQAYATEENPHVRKQFETALSQAMHACLGRGFSGHGYEADEGFNDTMEIFEKAEMYSFVEKYPDINREFTFAYLKARRRWKAKESK